MFVAPPPTYSRPGVRQPDNPAFRRRGDPGVRVVSSFVNTRDEASTWRAAVVIAVCALTAAAAHATGGGGSPGPGGLVVLLLLLSPVALIVRTWAGTVGLLAAGAVGQILGHVGLGLVTGSSEATVGQGAAHTAHAAHGSRAPHPAGGSLDAAMDSAGGWSSLTEPLAHLLHMRPAMAFAHVLAVVVTAVLVTAVTTGLRRIASRFVVWLRAILLSDTPAMVARPVPPEHAAATAPLLLSRPLRGPPLYA